MTASVRQLAQAVLGNSAGQSGTCGDCHHKGCGDPKNCFGKLCGLRDVKQELAVTQLKEKSAAEWQQLLDAVASRHTRPSELAQLMIDMQFPPAPWLHQSPEFAELLEAEARAMETHQRVYAMIWFLECMKFGDSPLSRNAGTLTASALTQTLLQMGLIKEGALTGLTLLMNLRSLGHCQRDRFKSGHCLTPSGAERSRTYRSFTKGALRTASFATVPSLSKVPVLTTRACGHTAVLLAANNANIHFVAAGSFAKAPHDELTKIMIPFIQSIQCEPVIILDNDGMWAPHPGAEINASIERCTAAVRLMGELMLRGANTVHAAREGACLTCGEDEDAGDLLRCEECGLFMHADCAGAPLVQLADAGAWRCAPCDEGGRRSQQWRGYGMRLDPAMVARWEAGVSVWDTDESDADD